MSKLWYIGGAVFIAYAFFYLKRASEVDMRNFKAAEFGAWFPSMSMELLAKLDDLRDEIGQPIMISPAVGSLGRVMGENEGSQHNITKWGEVRAADVMFPKATKEDLNMIYEASKRVGFTGIGVYPQWKPYAGMHLDVRQERTAGSPAQWAGLMIDGKQQYVGIWRAFT